MAFLHGMLHLFEPLAPRGQRKLTIGVDSALVLAIAVDALGKDKVRAVMMPSPYTADISHPIISKYRGKSHHAHCIAPHAAPFSGEMA